MSTPETDDKLAQIQERLDYRFTEPALLATALRHASAAGDELESNQRLEFLGDAVLSLVIAHHLYERFPQKAEGDLTRLKSSIVSRNALFSIASELNIGRFIEFGGGLSEDHETLPDSILADALEALIGAIYLDGGIEPARRFIVSNVQELLDSVLKNDHPRNYKSILQHLCQIRYGCVPRYVIRTEVGPDHSKEFEAVVFIGEEKSESAWGRSKKEAEQLAAMHSLQRGFPEWQKYNF